MKDGRTIPIEDIIEQFYDIRHALAFDFNSPAGRRIEAEIYDGYPERFRGNALRALHEKGVPRNRFLQNAVGLCEENFYILQRGGTIEEIGVLERARMFMGEHGVPFEVALAVTRAGNVTTTHTPVAAGFALFPGQLVRQYLTAYAEHELHIDVEQLLALGRENPAIPTNRSTWPIWRYAAAAA